MIQSPDLIVMFGPRAVVSLVGVIAVVVGTWRSDRIWDEKGSAAYNQARRESLTNPLEVVSVPDEYLQEATPIPFLSIFGWLLLACSYFLATDPSWNLVVFPLELTISPGLMCLLLGWVSTISWRNAVKQRIGTRILCLNCLDTALWLVLTVFSGVGWVALIFRAVGAICLSVARKSVLWKHSKMGLTWVEEGRPNPHPVVCNMGGPLFVFGWFLFWLGMTTTTGFQEDQGVVLVPVYLSLRTLLALLGGCGMVPIVMLVEYARDEAAEPTEFGLYGTDGRFFGCFESPWPSMACWTLFGFSNLIPLTHMPFLQNAILVNCILLGIVSALTQAELHRHEHVGKSKCSMVFACLFLCLVWEVSLNVDAPVAWVGCALGGSLILTGRLALSVDRKQGHQNRQGLTQHPNPVVYSAGGPLLMTGWILLWLAMSIPPNSNSMASIIVFGTNHHDEEQEHA